MPIAATTQSVAAVVSPRTERPSRMIAPAPRKPMPVTICAAMRVGSARTTSPPLVEELVEAVGGDEREERRAERDEQVRADARPRGRAARARSRPRRRARRDQPEPQQRRPSRRASGSLIARSCNRLLLEALQVLDPGCGEVEQLVEPRAVERHLLGGRLHLDEAPVAGHHDVHVDVGVRVLGVVEVEQRHAVDDADRDGGDRRRSAPSRARTGRARDAPRRTRR